MKTITLPLILLTLMLPKTRSPIVGLWPSPDHRRQGHGGDAARRWELGQRALGRYSIAVIDAEPRLAYNRVLALAAAWPARSPHPISQLKPAAAVAGDAASRRFYGRAVCFHRPRGEDGHARGRPEPALCQAGARHRFEPAASRLSPASILPGVATFRDTADVDLLRAHAERGSRIVVIGGGLLGLEAAYGLAEGRRQGHASPSRRPADGAPARSPRALRCSRREMGQARHRGPAQRRDQGLHRQRPGRGRRARGRLRSSRPTSSSSPSACVPMLGLAKAAGVAVNRGILGG